MTVETVALVFTDLVGSTELSNRIGPGAANGLRREHFALLRRGCEVGGGREVKNLGDGLMLAFGSASAAVDAAVAAQQAIAARNRRADQRFEVRMGVAVGEVTPDEGDYFGEAVVQAARLCALADGGQILVTDFVRALAGSSTSHGFRSVGPLELKGLPDPVVTHEVVWASTSGPTLPLPRRLRGAPEGAYVGREAERAALDAAWKQAGAGVGGLVLVAGEPGIGKTRLASHHAFAVHETGGGTVLYGAVDEGLGVPYQPWIEALTHYVDHVADTVLAAHVDDAGPDLARLVPALGRRLPGLPAPAASDGETERYLLLDAVTRWLRAAAADNPVLVVLDDLHWADKASLLLLTHVHRHLADAGVLFVGTYRDSEVAAGGPLADTLATMRREERVERLELTGLDLDQIVEVLRHASGQDSTANAVALAQVLARDTNGNPLFVGEVLRQLVENGHLGIGDDGLWTITTDLDSLPAPASVRDVVDQRVQRLGADAALLLATAAVIGQEFDLDVLATVLERSVDDLLDTLDAAMAASLLSDTGTRTGSLRFIHALIAQALVDGLSRPRLAQLHGRVAAAIEALHGPDLGGRIGIVARHRLAAGEDPVKTIDYARRAGQHALAGLAPDEALRWFQTALDLVDGAEDDPRLRCDLLTDLGEAMRDAGIPGYRDRLIAAATLAEQLDDGDRLARAVLATNRLIAASVGNTDTELVAAMEAALARRPQPDATRALLLAQFAAEQMFVAPLERRRALIDEALGIARALDDVTMGRVLVSSAAALQAAPAVEQRQALLDELAALLPRLVDPLVRAHAALQAAQVAIEVGDREALDRAMAAARTACDATVQPAPRWQLSTLESLVAGIAGDLPLAEHHANEGFALASSSGIEDGLLFYGNLSLNIRSLQGNLGSLVDMMLGIAASNSTFADTYRATVAVALADAGRLEEADIELDRAVRELAVLPRSASWSVAISSMAMTISLCRRPELAPIVYDAARNVPDVLVMTGASCTSHMSTSLGVLADAMEAHDAAEEHFARAAGHLAAFGAPILLAYNSREHGRVLLDRGDPADRDRARGLLTEALEMFLAHDCAGWAATCEDLLAGVAGEDA